MLKAVLLTLAAAAIVPVAMFATQPVAGNAVMLLLLALLILIVTTLVWTRRQGLISPVPIIALGLGAYFPIRGIVLLSAGLTNDQGVNQNVLNALGSAALPASVDVLIVAVLFAVTCEVVARIGGRAPSAVTTAESTGSANRLLVAAGTILLFIGVAGVIAQVPAGLGFLQGDEASGGFVVQAVFLASFGFSLGLILSGRGRRTLPGIGWALLAVVAVLGFYMGSKDTLFQPLLALLFAGATLEGARPKRRIAAVGLTAGLLVFLIFPAVTTYRNEVFSGQSFGPAVQGVPGTLVSRTIVGSRPRSGGVPAYVADCLLYLTNRLSGFDALVLAANAEPDPELLTVRTIMLAPLGLVIPSGYWSSSTPQVAHYFGQRYWGSVPTSNVSTGITVFAQAQFAFGTLAVIPAAVFIGLLAALAARPFRSPNPLLRAVGFVFMVSAIGFERDVLYLLVTTERRLALIGIVAAFVALGSRGMATRSWQAAEPAVTPIGYRRSA